MKEDCLTLVHCGPRIFLWRWVSAPDWWVDLECWWAGARRLMLAILRS